MDRYPIESCESLETRRLFSTPTISTSAVTVTQGTNSEATITVKLSAKAAHQVK
ncbi:MAG: hypothetical protein JO353_13960, partial [Phycisphaerae bacterium]|nr:hypothetical protein [Phycisphaerae bacterium]